MKTRSWLTAGMAAAVLLTSACATPQEDGTATGEDTTATQDGTTTGTTGSSGSGGVSTGGTSGAGEIPALVNVNLQNVLNNLSVALSVEQANVPVNAQVPIEVAANVCGVSVSALAASIASGQAGCTATTTSPELVQSVQQQVAAGGSVTGGDQTMDTPTGN